MWCILNIDHGKPVRALKFSSNNQLLISGSEDLHINVNDTEVMKRKQTLTGHAE